MTTDLAEAILEFDDARRAHEELRLVEPISPEAWQHWVEMCERSRRELRRMAAVVDRLREEAE